jgi:hypothetical protein
VAIQENSLPVKDFSHWAIIIATAFDTFQGIVSCGSQVWLKKFNGEALSFKQPTHPIYH